MCVFVDRKIRILKTSMAGRNSAFDRCVSAYSSLIFHILSEHLVEWRYWLWAASLLFLCYCSSAALYLWAAFLIIWFCIFRLVVVGFCLIFFFFVFVALRCILLLLWRLNLAMFLIFWRLLFNSVSVSFLCMLLSCVHKGYCVCLV